VLVIFLDQRFCNVMPLLFALLPWIRHGARDANYIHFAYLGACIRNMYLTNSPPKSGINQLFFAPGMQHSQYLVCSGVWFRPPSTKSGLSCASRSGLLL
jgi:hypothetical protein